MEPVKRRNDSIRKDYLLGAGQILSPRGTKAWSPADPWMLGVRVPTSCTVENLRIARPPTYASLLVELTLEQRGFELHSNGGKITYKMYPPVPTHVVQGQLYLSTAPACLKRSHVQWSRLWWGQWALMPNRPFLSKQDYMAEVGTTS